MLGELAQDPESHQRESCLGVQDTRGAQCDSDPSAAATLYRVGMENGAMGFISAGGRQMGCGQGGVTSHAC